MNRYSVEIGDQPYFQRRKFEKKNRGKPAADSRVMQRAVPYREAAPVQPAPVVHQAMPMAPMMVPVMYVPVAPIYPASMRSSSDDMGMFLGGGVTGGLIVGLFAIFLAVLI